jgi:hypothetical protein
MQIRQPGLNPNQLLVIFRNGAARAIQMQPGKRGVMGSYRMVDLPKANEGVGEDSLPTESSI